MNPQLFKKEFIEKNLVYEEILPTSRPHEQLRLFHE